MIKKLNQADWDYYRKHLKDCRSLQEKDLLGRMDADLYKAYYMGEDSKTASKYSDSEEEILEKISLNKIYPATNRVVPSLYYQNPRIKFTPRKGTTGFAADIATATINYDYREKKVKRENQKTILDAWYVGTGVCKIGYQTRFVYKEQEQKKRGLFGRQPDAAEKEIDYIEYEGPWVKRLNPLDVFRDAKRPVDEDRIIWIRYKRTLQDIIEAGFYEYDREFVQRFGKKDNRDVELELYEGWIRTKEGLFILVEVDGYNKPIRWEKSSWLGDGFPICFLTFAEMNDEYYPVSPMKVAIKQQKHINYGATLQMNIIDHFINMIGVNETALTEEGKKLLRTNPTGGILKFKQAISGNVGPITSATIPADLFAVVKLMQDNLQECLTTSGLRLGSSESEKTLGQDQMKEMGNVMGMSGMQDKIREYVMEQAQKVLQMRKQFSTAREIVPITGMDIINPITGKLITDEWLEFGTPGSPVTLKEAIAGDYDCDVDIKSALKPNEAQILMVFDKMIEKLISIEPILERNNQKIDFGRLVKSWLSAHKDVITNADTFVVQMTEEEVQEKEQAKQLQQQMAMLAQQKQEQEVQSGQLDSVKKSVNIAKEIVPEEEEGEMR